MADFLQAVQVGAGLADQRLQRDYRNKLLAGQEAERMLRMQGLQQEAKKNALLLDEATNKLAAQVKERAMFEMATKEYAQAVQGGMDRSEAAFNAFAPLQLLGKGSLDDVVRAGIALKKEKEGFTPGFGTATNPITGQPEAFFRTSPNSANRVVPPAASVPADIRIADEITKLQGDIAAATDPAQKEGLQRRLTNLQVQTAPSGMEVTTPDGTVIRQGKGVGTKIPAGIVTKAQERLSGTQKTVELLDDLQGSLRPTDVGVAGVAGNLILDKLLPQIGVPSADASRMDNRTKLKTLIEGALRQVSADSRFSNADRKAIEGILPSAGMVESFESTQQTINTLRRIFAKRALIDAHEIGQDAPGFAVQALDEVALAEAVRSGLLSREKAVNEVRRRQPKAATP